MEVHTSQRILEISRGNFKPFEESTRDFLALIESAGKDQGAASNEVPA